MKNNYEVIFWDFDGVLMNSNEIRDKGFLSVLSDYPDEKVKQLLKYHQNNGGLSRYVKFRYFFNNILGKGVSDKEIDKLAVKFSNIMRKLLIDDTLLINETLDYVKKEHKNKNMHIVSGSDQSELRYLCKELNIDYLFTSINGSPIPKKENVKRILINNKLVKNNCVLIGDSINDYEAAIENDIDFIAYNNTNLLQYSTINWNELNSN